MKLDIQNSILITFIALASNGYASDVETISLTVIVDNLRNSDGYVQFALYNSEGSIPDFDYEKYYRKRVVDIIKGSSTAVFENLPKGKYAVSVLHDENMNGAIDMGFILPIEGVGFTNYSSIGFTNKPDFSGASLDLSDDKKVVVSINYL